MHLTHPATPLNADEQTSNAWYRRRQDEFGRRVATARKELTAGIHSVHYAASKLTGLLVLLDRPADGEDLEIVARNLALHAEFVARTAFEVVQSAQVLAGVGVCRQALERSRAARCATSPEVFGAEGACE